MRHYTATYQSAAFLPVLSLDALTSSIAADAIGFDIADEESVPLDEHVERAEALAAINDFVNGLAERDRLIVRRLFWLGHTQTQIAVDLGVSKMAISKAVKRILNQGHSSLAAHRHLTFLN